MLLGERETELKESREQGDGLNKKLKIVNTELSKTRRMNLVVMAAKEELDKVSKHMNTVLAHE